jgi:hypothetical protein
LDRSAFVAPRAAASDAAAGDAGVANHDSTHRISVINQTSREAPLPRLLIAVIDRDREPLYARF